MRDKGVRKILIFRGGALGDFIVTLPAILALRHAFPAAQVELVGNARAAEIARTRGWLQQVHSQHEGRWATLFGRAKLPAEFATWLAAFDLVVNYWPDPDGSLARHFPAAPTQRFVSAEAMPSSAPAAAHFCAPLQPLGITMEETFCRITPLAAGAGPAPSSAVASATVAAHPGSGSPRKNWPRERWLDLLAEIAAPVLLIVGEAEAETWNPATLARSPLASRLRDGTLRIAANLPLETLIGELGQCRQFVGHDSGIGHLAAACGVSCVLLFGPTDPAVWAPPASHVRVLRPGADLAAISVSSVREALA